MNEQILERIADALEGIRNELAEINHSIDRIDRNLDRCIAQSGNNHFICVTGSINTSGY